MGLDEEDVKTNTCATLKRIIFQEVGQNLQFNEGFLLVQWPVTQSSVQMLT